jgi:hypothetical protein
MQRRPGGREAFVPGSRSSSAGWLIGGTIALLVVAAGIGWGRKHKA